MPRYGRYKFRPPLSPVPKQSKGHGYHPHTLFGGKGQKQHEYLYWEFHERGGRVAVRMGNWKGVKLNFGKNPQAPMQLFNLENDVHEDCDVSEQHPDIVEQMEIFIKQAHVKSDLFPYPFEK